MPAFCGCHPYHSHPTVFVVHHPLQFPGQSWHTPRRAERHLVEPAGQNLKKVFDLLTHTILFKIYSLVLKRVCFLKSEGGKYPTVVPCMARLLHCCMYHAFVSWAQWQLEGGDIRLLGGRLFFGGLDLENDGENVSVN